MLLAIVRHAKAQKDSPTGLDLDRALTEVGLRQARHLGTLFAAHSTRPDASIASRAVRTRQTAEAIATACTLDFDFDDRLLVGAPVSAALQLIAELGAGPINGRAPRFLVLVGHNDQVSDLALALTRGLGASGPDDSGKWDPPIQLATGQAVVLNVPNPAAPIGRCELLDSWRLPSGD